MNKELIFNPYIRRAMYHTWLSDFVVERALFDFELIYIDSGKLNIQIANNTYTANEGDVLLIPPGINHKITWAGVNCSQPHIHFDFERDEKSKDIPISNKTYAEMNSYELSCIRENYLAKKGLQLPYLIKPTSKSKVRDLFLEIINVFSFDYPLKELELEGLLKTLIAILIGDSLGEHKYEETDTISMLVKFMKENLNQNLTLVDFELKTNLTSWTLNHHFNEKYKTTPKKYYDSLRVNYVKSLILHSYKSIKEISAFMNFNGSQSFSRWFKNMTGFYPTEYKNHKKTKR